MKFNHEGHEGFNHEGHEGTKITDFVFFVCFVV
jgi:hypothetical protein